MKSFNFIFMVCTICSFSIASHSTNMGINEDLSPYTHTSHGGFFNMEKLLDIPGGQHPNYPSYTANVNVQQLATRAPYQYLEGTKLEDEQFAFKNKILGAKILGNSTTLADIFQCLSEYKSICYYYAKTNVIEDRLREVVKIYFVEGTNNIFTILHRKLYENTTCTTSLGKDYSNALTFINNLKKSGLITHRQNTLLHIYEHADRCDSYIEKNTCLVYADKLFSLPANLSNNARAARYDLIYREFEMAIKNNRNMCSILII